MMDTPFFLAGFVLAVLPPKLFLLSHERLIDSRSFETMRFANRDRRSRSWWKSPYLFIDPVRGAAATWLLLNFTPPFLAAALPARAVELLVPALLAVAIGVQATWASGDSKIIFPAGFIAGCSLAGLPLVVAVGALVVSSATAFAARTWNLMGVTAFVCIVLLSVLMLGPDVSSLAFAGLWLVPLILAIHPTMRMVVPLRF